MGEAIVSRGWGVGWCLGGGVGNDQNRLGFFSTALTTPIFYWGIDPNLSICSNRSWTQRILWIKARNCGLGGFLYLALPRSFHAMWGNKNPFSSQGIISRMLIFGWIEDTGLYLVTKVRHNCFLDNWTAHSPVYWSVVSGFRARGVVSEKSAAVGQNGAPQSKGFWTKAAKHVFYTGQCADSLSVDDTPQEACNGHGKNLVGSAEER